MNDERDAPRSLDTTAIHAAEEGPFWADALLPPVVQSSTFVFPDAATLIANKEGGGGHYEYSRFANPTVAMVEAKLAALEGAEAALLVSSGMAALATVLLGVLATGRHIVYAGDLYPGTRMLLERLLGRFGVEASVVPAGDLDTIAAAIRPNTGLLFTEFPTNPHLRLIDLEALAELGRRQRALTVVDATLASPVLCRPLSWGIDLVVHSATKYLGGHNDLLAGVVCGATGLIEALRETRALLGPVLAPWEAYLLNRGLKTLPLRMQRHSETGARVAAWLAERPEVEAVFYPGWSGADEELARRYLPNGRGGLVSFRIRGGLEAAQRFLDHLELIRHGGSLGGCESLAMNAYMMSYWGTDPELARDLGAEPELVRLSLGLEQVEELLADLERALVAAAA